MYFDTVAEHVFELHMIKDFFFWLFQDKGIDCNTLQKVFGDGGDDSNANLIMQQLAWYDPALPEQGFPGELFVLNRGLNHLKGAVSSRYFSSIRMRI